MAILNQNSGQRKYTGLAAVVLVLAAGIGIGVRLFGQGVGGASNAQSDGPHTPGPKFLHQGDTLFVPEGSPLRARLVVQPVTMKDTPHQLQLPASVEANPARTVNILPPVTGRLIELKVRLGDRVTKGQPLAVIDSGDLAQAYADDDKANDALARTERTLTRVRGLHDAGAGALKDIEQAESDQTQAQAEHNRAESRLKTLGVAYQTKTKSRQLTLLAPTAGSVTALSTSPGAYLNDLTASLMTIANLDSVWVTANVPEGNIAQIGKGQQADVTFAAYPEQVFHGTVAFVSDVLEPDTRRVKARINFANPQGKLKPNMFATASFSIPEHSTVFVPNAALLMNNDSTVVLVEVAPWTFVKRPVQPGFGEDDGARISQGLAPGDRVIVKGGVLLND